MSKKIIAVCGSYGKTTVKEILFQILSAKFKVLQSFGNENTPLGISKLVNKLTNQHQILLLEFGEFVVGDIRGLCKLFPPNIGIITGINNQHRERMGGLENATKCMFEMAEFCQVLVLNIDDQNICENWQKYVQKDQQIWFYSSKNHSQSSLFFQKAEFDKEKLTWKVEIPKENLESLQNLLDNQIKSKMENQNELTKENQKNQEIIDLKIKKHDKNEINSSQILENILESDYELESKATKLENRKTEVETEEFEVKLLGNYAVGNLICGIIIGKLLEMANLQIQTGLQNVKPIKHRLEPIWNEKSQVLVIDDSYNGNIDGVLEAIDVLARLK